MVRKNKETQIKGEKQLEDLTNSVIFMSTKFDEYEKKRLEREDRTVELESRDVSLSTKVEKLGYKVDTLKQYSRRNPLLIHDMPKEKGQDTDHLAIKTVKEKMGLDISSGDIDRTHRIGTPPKQSGKKIDLLLVRLYGTKTG